MCADRTLFEPPHAPNQRWTNAEMDALREATDPPADALIAEFFADHARTDPHTTLMALMNHRIDRGATAEDDVPVPQALLDELERRCPLPNVATDSVREGQQLFQDHGPEMLMILCCYSLPMAYGAANGAHVLHETGYLENRVVRRLVETTQMVIDVMKPGGLECNGRGVRTAHEVRLMHAAIRYLILHRERHWDAAWGKPINQEDLAGTLMTFSYVVLDGLAKLGIVVSPAQQESYLAAWRAVGRAMGVRDELLPADMLAARELTWFIHDRQMHGSKIGRDLTRALLDAMRSKLPLPAQPMCASLMRLFVEPRIADGLGVPRNPVLDAATVFSQRLYGALDDMLHIAPLGLGGYRLFSMLVIDALKAYGRGHDHRAPFEIPTELGQYWRLRI